MTPDELKARIAEDGVEFVYAMFVEMHGKPCAKLVPVSAIDDLLEVGAGFAGFAAGPLSQTPADPDILAIPDPASYTRLPWQPNVAAMQCDATVEGELWPYAPRVLLQRAMEPTATCSRYMPSTSRPCQSLRMSLLLSAVSTCLAPPLGARL